MPKKVWEWPKQSGLFPRKVCISYNFHAYPKVIDDLFQELIHLAAHLGHNSPSQDLGTLPMSCHVGEDHCHRS